EVTLRYRRLNPALALAPYCFLPIMAKPPAVSGSAMVVSFPNALRPMSVVPSSAVTWNCAVCVPAVEVPAWPNTLTIIVKASGKDATLRGEISVAYDVAVPAEMEKVKYRD